jgi:hypothetical protein
MQSQILPEQLFTQFQPAPYPILQKEISDSLLDPQNLSTNLSAQGWSQNENVSENDCQKGN